MASSTTYALLLAQVQSYVDDDVTEFVAELPQMIARAQDRIQRDMELTIWAVFTTHHVSAGSATVAKLGDWIKVYSIYMPVPNCFATRRSYDYVRSYGGTGVPRHFAEYTTDGTIHLCPTPDQNYSATFEALERLPVLSATNTTNWIAENLADMLLYATLVEAEAYLVGQERKAEFEEAYAKALGPAKKEFRHLERSVVGDVG